MKTEKHAGANKSSFRIYYAGGEIWIEHLDGIYEHADLAAEKFENDYLQFKLPSMPSLMVP
ncbi:MAG: hypothetical protein Q4G07_09685 [Oscillospiraceae bacterium]|nr:hypothetical protein [Oscillospiraceae bacterium]